MWYAVPSAATPMGMITGTNWRDSRSSISAVSMLSTSPTNPRSGASGSSAGTRHRARVDEAPVLAVEPDRASAVLVDERRELLVELAQRHLDDVERALVGDAHAAVAPALMPICCISSSMRQPPPCTTMGFMPTRRSSATSRANPAFSAGSAIASPPKRITSVLP